MPQPVSLEWSIDAKAGEVERDQVPAEQHVEQTTGRYTWEVPDENLWKFYVRARAVDKAANTGEHIWGQDRGQKNPPTEVHRRSGEPVGRHRPRSRRQHAATGGGGLANTGPGGSG